MGRLAGWTDGRRRRSYRYDAMDRVGCITDKGVPRYRYYEDGKVACESGTSVSSYLAVDGTIVAETILAGDIRHVLLGCDMQGSVLQQTSESMEQPVYTAYGDRGEKPGGSDVAFAGELRDRETGWYLLGSYRAYNPRLMRFHSPDASCPFGKGGLNAYAYGLGDPVNHVDPTGENVLALVASVVGALVTIGLMIWSAPAILSAAGAVWGAIRGSLVGVAAAEAAATGSTVAGVTVADVATTASTAAGLVGVGLDVSSAVETSRHNEEIGEYLAIAGILTGSLAGILGAGPRAVPAVARLSSRGMRNASEFMQAAVSRQVVDVWSRASRGVARPSVIADMPMQPLRRASSTRVSQAERVVPAVSQPSTAGVDGKDPWRFPAAPAMPVRKFAARRNPVSYRVRARMFDWLDKAYARMHNEEMKAALRRGSLVEESEV
jgi:RHS repeat-associated protein